MLDEAKSPQPQLQEAFERIAQLEATLATTRTALAQATTERDKLRRAYEQLKEQLELLRRRMFIAKAERIDVRQLEIEFEQTHTKLQALARELGDDALPPPAEPPPDPKPPRPKPTGRRNLKTLDMPEERIELLDPARRAPINALVANFATFGVSGLCDAWSTRSLDDHDPGLWKSGHKLRPQEHRRCVGASRRLVLQQVLHDLERAGDRADFARREHPFRADVSTQIAM